MTVLNSNDEDRLERIEKMLAPAYRPGNNQVALYSGGIRRPGEAGSIHCSAVVQRGSHQRGKINDAERLMFEVGYQPHGI